VTRQGETLFLNFPADNLEKQNDLHQLKACIGVEPQELYKGKTDFIAFVNSEATLKNLKLDFNAIAGLDARGLIVTAKGNHVDFVSRFFGPNVGVNEDPVTGSAHTSLTPLWSEKLRKEKMSAKQLSKRGGNLICINNGDRVLIGGKAKLYLEGEIYID
jgi:predicted PhzF superfamily epimerase YddE/YHI9